MKFNGRMMRLDVAVVAIAPALMLAACGANGSGHPASPGATPSHAQTTATQIITQPVRDVGIAETEIPPLLAQAVEFPYGLEDGRSCEKLSASIAALNDILGPDFGPEPGQKESRAGKLAEAGGQTVVNSLIPFRGLVREISGAAPAQRRLNVAISAGFARRGFLRGVYLSRRCKPAF